MIEVNTTSNTRNISVKLFQLGSVVQEEMSFKDINEPVHEISNNVLCVPSKASDQPAHMRSLIRAFASRRSIL